MMVQAFGVSGEGSTFCDDMTDRVFPLVNNLDFDEFSFREQVDESPFCIGFDFAAAFISFSKKPSASA